MSLDCSTAPTRPADLDAFVTPVTSDPGGLEAAGLDPAQCARRRFSGRPGEVLVREAATGELVVALGVGDRAGIGRERLRVAAAAATRSLSACAGIGIDLAPLAGALPDEIVARSLVEGAALCADRFEAYRSSGEGAPALERLVLVGEGAAAAGAAAGVVVAEAVALARRLVNTPASDCTPAGMAAEAVALAERDGLEVTVLDEHDAQRERLGGLLAVGRGSDEPPRLVRLAYRPEVRPGAPEPATVALVGKGITFDSGGLSLKTPASMTRMKTDMGGAAAVLATVSACRRLGLPVAVVGFLALAENLPSGRATKPGDVLRARNGRTIEVLNTDAEGRLVLADALSLAAEEAPDAIVDLATLTGACVAALGRSVAGLLGNDDRLVAALEEAGRQAGEPSWHLPLPPAYRSLLDSEVADLANVGPPGQAGALLAGLVLQEFVGTTPWAHLDIAGPARSEEEADYRHKGATGFGVRTLVELLEHYVPLASPASTAPASQAVPA